MKNLKKIITLLVLTMTVFSCQTNDELVEFESLNKNNLNIQNSDKQLINVTGFTNVIIEYKKNLSEQEKEQITEKETLAETNPIIIEESSEITEEELDYK